MSNIYEPAINDNYRTFIFKDDLDEDLEWEDSYAPLLLDSFGKNLSDKLVPLEVIPNPDEKKKRAADISLMGSNSLIILKASVYECLKDKLSPYGQLIPVANQGGDFVGFHVNRILVEAVIWESSDYREENGNRILYAPTLEQSVVEGNYIFMLQESKMRLYVSQDFFDDCQTYEFSGIDWAHSKEIRTR